MLEVGNERPSGSVGVATANVHVFGEVAVVIPTAVIKMDEAGSTFCEAPSEQAVGSEATVPRGCAVEIEHMLGFVADVDEARDGGLHAVGHLIGSDTSVDLRIVNELVPLLIQLADGIDE